MSKSISEIMRSGKKSLQGKWGLAIGTFLVYEIIIGSLQGGYRHHLNEELNQGFSFVYSARSLIYLVVAGPLALGASIFL